MGETDVVEVAEKEPLVQSTSEIFLRGLNYIDSQGQRRSLGFRGDINKFIYSADNETGHFKVGDEVDEEGHIQRVFYSESSHPMKAKLLYVSWQRFITEGRPEVLEAKCLYLIPER